MAVCLLSAIAVSCKKETAVSEEQPIRNSVAKNETKENQYKPIDTACSPNNKMEDYIMALQWYSNKINKEMAGNSPEQNTKVYDDYIKIREKYTDCLNISQTEILDKYIDYHTNEPGTGHLPDNIKKMAAELNKAGLEFREMGEGLTEIHSLPGYYESVFKNKVTPDYQAYISLMAKDDQENYAVNGGLLITWEELGERLIAWEKFISQYPKSPLIKAAKNKYHDYLLDYLLGMDSDRIYDSEAGVIYEDKKEAYNTLIRKYPNSSTAKKTKELIAAYDANVPAEQIDDKINLRR
ncbi:hypothetical protein DRF67_00190 [Chryseobacterium pennipullorum]|uniref:Uncharacterized protein n=2 Tax=Chryseobacterium pennipullorum TaxID=2258963 RepID=A0A3D9BA45_9FLAO|nr:hypothetical protein DRF67_00190 [Chryseobacterium pennipullorum]